MPATLRAASSGNLSGTAAATVTPTLPAGATDGDIVYALVSVGQINAGIATGWAVSTGWTLLDGSAGTANSGGATHATNVAWKVLQAGDTAPVFSWTNTGKIAWVAVAFTPDAGETIAHDSAATPVVDTTAATTHTPPSLAAGGTSGVSLVLTGARAFSNGATAVTTTPPTGWTEPTNGDNSTAVSTTATTRQVAASLSYQSDQTGTIAPGAETVTGGTAGGSTCANVYHLLFTSAGSSTSADAAGSIELGGTAAYTPPLGAGGSITLGGAAAYAFLPPAGLTVTPASSTQLNLSWTAAAGATKYDIERDGVVIVSNLTGTSYSDTGLTATTTYSYRIRSVR